MHVSGFEKTNVETENIELVVRQFFSLCLLVSSLPKTKRKKKKKKRQWGECKYKDNVESEANMT